MSAVDWLPSWKAVLAFLVTAIALALQPAIVRGILALTRRLWPMSDSDALLQREAELRERYGNTFSHVEGWLTVLMFVSMVLTPFLIYQAVRRLAAATSDAGGEFVFFHGFAPVAIPIMIGAFIAPAALGPAVIRITQRGEARDAMLFLFSLGDRDEGGLNRYIVRRASRISLGFLLIPLAFAGDRYTVVGSSGIDVRSGAWSRELIPPARVVAGGIALRSPGRDEVCLLLDDDRVLDNNEDDGPLDSWSADAATPAVQFLHARWRLPVEWETNGDRPACALARQALRSK